MTGWKKLREDMQAADVLILEGDMNTFIRAELNYGKHAVAHADFEAAPPAPAWYLPETADAFVNIPLVMKHLEKKDWHSAIRGLLIHEVAHAEWSKWLTYPGLNDIDDAVITTATMLEEMRIEYRAVKTSPDSRRVDIRSALPLSIGSDTEHKPRTTYEAARLWALGVGRALTSVVSPKEVQWVDLAARHVLTDDVVDQLVDLLQESLELEMPRALNRMIDIAEEWNELVGVPDKPTVMMIKISSCSHGDDGDEGEEGEGSGSSEDGGEDEGEGHADGMAEEIGEEAAEALREAVEKAVTTVGKTANKVPTVVAKKLDVREAAAASMSHIARNKRLSAPTPAQVRLVATTARELERLVVPGVTKTNVPSVLPPGRLKFREAVRADAERAGGRLVTAEPWRKKKRHHELSKPILVGIATDTSGSMKWAEAAVAQFAYVWTNAGARIGARAAAVTFGDRVDVVVKPTELPSDIRTISANAGHEECDFALATLDGLLQLRERPDASKLVLIVSDGALVKSGEIARVIDRMKELKASGVTMVWITPSSSSHNNLFREIKRDKLAIIVETTTNNASMSVHQAALAALTALIARQHTS